MLCLIGAFLCLGLTGCRRAAPTPEPLLTAPPTATDAVAPTAPPTAPPTATTAATETPTPAPPTATPVPPTPTWTLEPTAAPTNTATPAPADEVFPIRLEIPDAAARETITGQLSAGATVRYVVAGEAGQPLAVDVASTGDALSLGITGEKGMILRPQARGALSWSGILPATQDYLIALTAPNAITYTLEVMQLSPVSPTAAEPEQLEEPTVAGLDADPQPIELESGTFASERGTFTPEQSAQQYTLTGEAGQLLTVVSYSSGAPIQILLENAEDQRWMANPNDDRVTELSVRLPSSGEYVVTLLAPLVTSETAFRVDFILSE
jgi:hypothetical protein